MKKAKKIKGEWTLLKILVQTQKKVDVLYLSTDLPSQRCPAGPGCLSSLMMHSPSVPAPVQVI